MQAQGARAFPPEEGTDKTLTEPHHHPQHAPRHWSRGWYLWAEGFLLTGPVGYPTGEPLLDWNDFQTCPPPSGDNGGPCLKQPLFLPREEDRSDFQCHIQLPEYPCPATV